jgi:hypothetical protein
MTPHPKRRRRQREEQGQGGWDVDEDAKAAAHATSLLRQVCARRLFSMACERDGLVSERFSGPSG